MIDLDQHMREEFARLTQGACPDLGIDPDRLLDAGHRRYRFRTVRRALSGAAVVALAAVAGWAGLTAAGRFDATTVPAAPASSQAWVANPAYFDLTGIALAESTPFRKVRLDVEPGDRGWEVTAELSTEDGRLLASYAFHTGTEVTVQRLSPQVAVALLPAATTWWDVAMHDPAESPSHVDSMRPGGLDVTAVLLTFDTGGEAGDVNGFIWEAADGSLVDNLGNHVPTSRVVLEGQSVTVYRDAALDRIGFRLDNGFTTAVHVRAEAPWTAYPRLQYSERSPLDDSTTWVLADVLPQGAQDLSVELAADRSAWTSLDLGGGTAYVIVTRSDTGGQPIRAIGYRDRSGRSVSFHR
ncbi:hypothetical protein [Propionicimonas sp.]|uniref:hypothetical protein n=1 Tax=Propionicimonas sp. TaxID=1955623 RepID=UPI0039E21C82